MTVVELKTRPAVVVASVIERLEEVLERARAGEISAVAIATVYSDGGAGCSWSETDNYWTMLGSISRLQHRMNAEKDCCG